MSCTLAPRTATPFIEGGINQLVMKPTPTENICVNCGIVYTLPLWKAKTQKCCSKECATAYRHKTRPFANNNMDRVKTKLLEKRNINPETGCWEYTGKLSTLGYGRIEINRSSVGVHRLSAYFWKGFDLDSDLVVCHTCDNPRCFNPDHLFIGTMRDNTQDMMKKERHVVEPHHKLSYDDVINIREAFALNTPVSYLAEKYGVTTRHIYDVVTMYSWYVNWEEK